MPKELAVYGASNAAGWSPSHWIDYDISRTAEASYAKPAFVIEGLEGIVIDLSGNPKLSDEEEFVVNAGQPGYTLPELMEELESEVLDQKPLHMFFLGGLNDPSLAITILHGSDTGTSGGADEAEEELRKVIGRSHDIDAGLEASSKYIASYIKRIIDTAQRNGIKPIVSTLPPYGATLAQFQNETEGQRLLKEGGTLVRSVNNHIRSWGEDMCIVDSYNLVVDAATGLSRPEFSYGISRPEASGDILHLNSFGHIQIATVLCKELHGKPVKIIPPQRANIQRA